MEKTDKIAILLATYNGEKYLEQQIASIEDQNEQEWMLFIHDDGSTDNTRKIIENAIEKNPSKIKYVEGPVTGGAKQNFFWLLEAVEAPFYMFCDQDDIWKQNKVRVTHERMKTLTEEKPALVFTELTVVDAKCNVIAQTMSSYQELDCKKITVNRLLMQNVVTGCTMEVNKKLRNMMLEYRNQTNIIMHDWWAALIAALEGETAFIEQPTILYRQHGKNSLGAVAIHSKRYLLARIRQGKEIRESLEMTRKQAMELTETFGLAEDTLPAEYSRIGEKTKVERLLFYKRKGIGKTGLARKIGLVIWG